MASEWCKKEFNEEVNINMDVNNNDEVSDFHIKISVISRDNVKRHESCHALPSRTLLRRIDPTSLLTKGLQLNLDEDEQDNFCINFDLNSNLISTGSRIVFEIHVSGMLKNLRYVEIDIDQLNLTSEQSSKTKEFTFSLLNSAIDNNDGDDEDEKTSDVESMIARFKKKLLKLIFFTNYRLL